MGKISAASRQSVKSISQLRERMAAFGWSANELSQQDTGEDVLVKIFNPGADARFDGTPSGLSFLAQVKSVAETVAEGLSVTIQLKVSDLKDWTDSDPSVVLFVWDVRSKIGYWRLANAICKELDETNPGWKTKTKVSTRFPVADSSDDAGLKRLRGRLADVALPSIARGRKVQVKLRFTFPKAIAKKVQRAYDFGTPYSIDPSYLSGIDFPDWYTRLYGISRPEIAGPVIMNAKAPDLSVDVRMEVKAPGELETLEFAVRATRVGRKEIELTNRADPEAPLWLTMKLRQGASTLTFSLNTNIRSPRKHLPAVALVEMMDRGLPMTLSLRSKSGWSTMGQGIGIKAPVENIARLLDAVKNLAVLESYADLKGILRLQRLTETTASVIRLFADGCRTGETLEGVTVSMGGVPRSVMDESEPKFVFDKPLNFFGGRLLLRAACIVPTTPDAMKITKRYGRLVDLTLERFQIRFPGPPVIDTTGTAVSESTGSDARPA